MFRKTIKPAPIFGTLLVAALLATMLFFPGSAHAWDSPCTPVHLNMLSSDLKVAADGTVYAIVKDANSDTITVFKFTGNCSNVSTIAAPPPSAGPGSARPQTDQPLSNVEARAPVLVLAPNGDILINYFVNYNIYYQRKPAAAASFNAAVLVATDRNAGDLAVDAAGNVHIVYWSPGVNYRRYSAADQLTVDVPISGTSADENPSVAADAAGNGHVVWGNINDHVIYYREVFANGSVGSTRGISNTPDGALFAVVRADVANNLHIAWQGALTGQPYQAFYLKCNAGATSCGSQTQVSSSVGNSLNPALVVCGETPSVGWRNNDSSIWQAYVSPGLTGPVNVSAGQWGFNPSLAGGGGYVHVMYQQNDNTPGYTRQSLAACGGAGGTPAPSATPCVSCPPAPTNLSNSGGLSAQAAVSVDASNQVHVVWNDNSPGNYEILYRKRNTDGSFAPPIASSGVNLSNNSGSSLQPAITAFGSVVDVGWTDNSSSVYNISVSTSQGGNNWTPPVNYSGSPVYAAYSSLAGTTDTHLWAVWQDETTGDDEIFARRDDFGGPMNISNSSTLDQYPRAAPGLNGKLFVVWQRGGVGNEEILFAAWSGSAWSGPNNISNLGASSTLPAIATAGDKIWVVFASNSGGTARVWMNTSADAGATWSGAVVVGTSAGAAQHPRIAVDGAGQMYYLTWGDSGQIYYKRQVDAPVVVSGSVTGSQRPDIGLGADLVPNIVWDDNSEVWLTRITTAVATATPTATMTPKPAPVHIMDTDTSRITYNGLWTVYNTGGSDGEYQRCGDSLTPCSIMNLATLTFTGGAVIWETAYANTYGVAQVALDGKVIDTVDLCAPNAGSATPLFANRTYFAPGNDPTASHSLTIQATGTHSLCTLSPMNYIVVDGFDIVPAYKLYMPYVFFGASP